MRRPSAGSASTSAARCASGDQGTATATVAPGMPELVVRVTPGGAIAGRVVDAAGKPVAGVEVMAKPAADADRTTIVNGRVTGGAAAATDAAGAFEITGLTAGAYLLGALEHGRPLPPRAAPPTVTVGPAEHKRGVELAVDRPDGVIRGTVTGPDGQPISWNQGMGRVLAAEFVEGLELHQAFLVVRTALLRLDQAISARFWGIAFEFREPAHEDLLARTLLRDAAANLATDLTDLARILARIGEEERFPSLVPTLASIALAMMPNP